MLLSLIRVMVSLLPFCYSWGWDGFAPIQLGSSPQFLSVGLAGGDRLELGAHSLVRKKQSMDVGRDQMGDPML